MKKDFMISYLLFIFIFTALILSGCEQKKDEQTSGNSEIVGIYMLEYRELPNGTKVYPPDINGMSTFTNTYRSLIVTWKDTSGENITLASIVEYELKEDTYTEKNIFHMASVPGSNGPSYDLSNNSETVTVTRSDGEFSFLLPLSRKPQVTLTFGATGWVARGPGFADYWEKIE